MDEKKLEKWASMLLDTGKRNNLVNYRDTKLSSVEVVLPDIEELFEKVDSETSFEVFDPEIEDDDDYVENKLPVLEDSKNEEKSEKLNRTEYINTYSSRIKKAKQILLYNANISPVVALKHINKKASAHIEETGVNVAYIAFGFIHWRESENSQISYRAPLLLAPVKFSRESLISPWFVQMTEEDVVLNPTFSFKLENEYGIKLPLYEDEGLTEYFGKVESKVAKLGWSVSRESKIGIFSFLKMNMYKDLMEHKEAILQNNNVKMLLGEPYEAEGVSIENGEHRLDNPLVELHNVVDADSSQIEAIEMAKAGVSFVLQGPPGTGKSQTITNIIAECIYDGKNVLFVSEKQAALNVVFDKLKKAGLEEFCLELHSYKANKKEVIGNLCKTLNMAKHSLSERAESEIDKKVTAQQELDSYENEIHKRQEVINKSLYQLYNYYSASRKAPDIRVSISDIDKKGDTYINNVDNLLEQFSNYLQTVGYEYKNNAWYGYCNQDTSYQMRENVKECFNSLIGILPEYVEILSNVEKNYGIECKTFCQADNIKKLFELIGESDIFTPYFFKESSCKYLLEKMLEMKELGRAIVNEKNRINQFYDEEIYKIESNEAYKKLTRQFTSGFGRLFNSEYKKLISDVKINRKDGKKLSYNDAIRLMEDLNSYHAMTEEFADIESPLKSGLGTGYKGVDSNWDLIIKEINVLKELFESGADFSKLEAFSNEEYNIKKADFEGVAEKIDELEKRCRNYIELLDKWFDNDKIDVKNIDIKLMLSKLQKCIDEFDKVDNWCSFRAVLLEMEKNSLLEFADAAIEAKVPTELIVLCYHRNFYRQWVDYILQQIPSLRNFNRVSHDKNVETFILKDKAQFEVSKAQIRAEISNKRPKKEFMTAGSAVSILQREGSKKRKQKSVRCLMEEMGELIQVLKPCFLMSPLSVSTFLNSEKVEFDVVIFDEASQIFPQDAIGAIYRGKQIIVVGDSKQMPPSNFFNATADIEDLDEETGDITDFESILDICSTVFAQLRLRWHYRSRFEQLIMFSNKNFYDNDLVSFPSAATDKKGIGIDYFYVDGTFDRRSRTNRKEAEFIVDLIFENIEKYPDRSLGVVAFSISQQDLIENLLSKRRQADPSKESFFKGDLPEPFFIKNLETVQGDERDTIIFSVAYAKDSAGKFLHNFGPLNRTGGERRLNVAVTRAKMNVQLVASIHHTDIDLSRTQAEGSRLLREYLDYAKNGEIALERTLTVEVDDQFDSEFELEVCEFLRENGFEVDTQVGCSNFKIDLGIKCPGTSDYVLAVECDGATYHSSKNARDRDRLRQQILENMGWKFYRIWSTDWFKNTVVEKEKLLEVARAAVVNCNSNNVKTSNIEPEQEQILDEMEYEDSTEEIAWEFPEYRMESMRFCANGWGFQNELLRVLKVEAPLSEEWLLKRIVWMFNRKKVTNIVREEFDKKMRYCESVGIIRKNGFLYIKDNYNFILRKPAKDNEPRDISYISLEELAAGMIVIIGQNVTVDKMGMYKEMAHILGFQRTTENMVERFDETLDLIGNNVVIEGNNVSIRKV